VPVAHGVGVGGLGWEFDGIEGDGVGRGGYAAGYTCPACTRWYVRPVDILVRGKWWIKDVDLLLCTVVVHAGRTHWWVSVLPLLLETYEPLNVAITVA